MEKLRRKIASFEGWQNALTRIQSPWSLQTQHKQTPMQHLLHQSWELQANNNDTNSLNSTLSTTMIITTETLSNPIWKNVKDYQKKHKDNVYLACELKEKVIQYTASFLAYRQTGKMNTNVSQRKAEPITQNPLFPWNIGLGSRKQDNKHLIGIICV